MPTGFQVILTLTLLGLSVYLTASLSSTIASLYTAVFAFVTFIAPGVLIWAQRFKKYVKLATYSLTAS